MACCVSPTPYLSTNALTLELVEAIDTDKVGNHDHYEVMPPLQYPQITFAPHSATYCTIAFSKVYVPCVQSGNG